MHTTRLGRALGNTILGLLVIGVLGLACWAGNTLTDLVIAVTR